MKKFKEAGNSRNIYEKEWDKSCFQQDIVYVAYKDLHTKSVSDKVLRNKVLRKLLVILNMIDIKYFFYCSH